MGPSESTVLLRRLENQVRTRTGWRVRNLVIEMRSEQIVLRGNATSYYVKQLAQHGVREILPYVGVHNTIAVEYPYDGPPRAA
jgi:hypothetical protein